MEKSATSANRRNIIFCTLAIAFNSYGCGSGSSDANGSASPTPCPTVLNPVIVVSVVDAITKQPISGASGQGWYQDMTTSQLVSVDKGLALALYPKAGVYSLLVQANGYQDWKKDQIVVNPDSSCPQSLILVAELIRKNN